MMDFIEPFTDDQVYALPDEGNGPSMRYILRGHTWYGSEAGVEGTTIAAGGFENTTAGGNTTVANVFADGEAAKAASASKE